MILALIDFVIIE